VRKGKEEKGSREIVSVCWQHDPIIKKPQDFTKKPLELMSTRSENSKHTAFCLPHTKIGCVYTRIVSQKSLLDGFYPPVKSMQSFQIQIFHTIPLIYLLTLPSISSQVFNRHKFS
jgi:hypothetical protein